MAMTTSFDPWTRDFNEASKLFDDIAEMVSKMGSLPPSGPDTQHHLSTIRRKRTILKNRLESLESLLPKHLSGQSMYVSAFPSEFCECLCLVFLPCLLCNSVVFSSIL